MKYYKLVMDVNGENDVICHYVDDLGLDQNLFIVGKFYEGWDGRFEFYYDKNEGYVLTDYIANDKGWFVVSKKLKDILQCMDTDIQFLPVKIIEKTTGQSLSGYYIANITRVVDALCLEASDYFETSIANIGIIYTVSKYGIYAARTANSDVFKLSNRQEIPIFVSDKFKKVIEEENITGICLREVNVV